MTIDTMSIIVSAVSLLVGIGLSCIAIWLSIHFFTKSKDAQTDTSITLAKINTQVDQLNNINENLFGRALGSLSQIAEQKVSAETTAVSEQAAAALREVMGALPEHLAALTERQVEERAVPRGAPGGENQISGHNLPNISDPFTLADLKREYISVLVFFMSCVGWMNNYGQQALIIFTEYGSDSGLINETSNNLNKSAELYKTAKQFLTELQETQPELFVDHPATAQIDGTIKRLEGFIHTFDEAVATTRSDASPGT